MKINKYTVNIDNIAILIDLILFLKYPNKKRKIIGSQQKSSVNFIDFI
jgi:hypothetical protein